jgi:hypothetical protein
VSSVPSTSGSKRFRERRSIARSLRPTYTRAIGRFESAARCVRASRVSTRIETLQRSSTARSTVSTSLGARTIGTKISFAPAATACSISAAVVGPTPLIRQLTGA